MRTLLDSKKTNYILMTVLVLSWGFEYVVAKAALEAFNAVTLIFFKYFVGIFVFLAVKAAIDRHLPFRKRDIPWFALCALFGDILYFASEYQAMRYLPVSIITIMLSFVPAVSIVIERVAFKRKATPGIVLGVIICVVGVSLVVGADFREMLSGRLIGYLLAFFAVMTWNVYNFVTSRLTENYNSLDLALYQSVGVLLLSAPYVVFHLPPPEVLLSGTMIQAVLYLGIASSGLGLLIYINAVRTIGVTPCALYSNMLPVTSTFFGILFLKEHIAPLQIVGGVVVIASGCLVIWLRDRQDRIQAALKEANQ